MVQNSDEMLIHCPQCRTVLAMDGQEDKCPQCGTLLLVDGNIYDFVGATAKQEEKGFYDGEYTKAAATNKKDTLDQLALLWDRPDAPQDALVRRVLGDIRSKRVIMLGNGASKKELTLLRDRPAQLVYSDLSPHAAMRIKASVDYSSYKNILRFAAIDAEHLPFVDDSVDIVYAYAMVHHLPNLGQFFSEVMRVLKPGGKAVFMDDAYSPIWHHSKQTWLKPLMKRSHRTTGISPEDYRFSMTGGFREGSLTEAIEAVGGTPYFERCVFLGYLVGRGAEKLLPRQITASIKGGWIQKLAGSFDNMMATFKFYRQNQIRLVWGFSK